MREVSSLPSEGSGQRQRPAKRSTGRALSRQNSLHWGVVGGARADRCAPPGKVAPGAWPARSTRVLERWPPRRQRARACLEVRYQVAGSLGHGGLAAILKRAGQGLGELGKVALDGAGVIRVVVLLQQVQHHGRGLPAAHLFDPVLHHRAPAQLGQADADRKSNRGSTSVQRGWCITSLRTGVCLGMELELELELTHFRRQVLV